MRQRINHDVTSSKKFMLVLHNLLFFGLFACRVSFAEDSEASKSLIRKYCEALAVNELHCECVLSVADDIGDGFLMGRYVLEGLLVNKGLESKLDFEKIRNEIDNSPFYLREGNTKYKEHMIALLGNAGYFGLQLQSKCGVSLKY